MAKASLSQRKTIGRVMHEFEHDELESGPGGKGGKVKSGKQAIAIALSEAGDSKFESAKETANTSREGSGGQDRPAGEGGPLTRWR